MHIVSVTPGRPRAARHRSDSDNHTDETPPSSDRPSPTTPVPEDRGRSVGAAIAAVQLDETNDLTPTPRRGLRDVVDDAMDQHRASGAKLRKLVNGFDGNPHAHLENLENHKDKARLEQEKQNAEDCTNLLNSIIEIMVRHVCHDYTVLVVWIDTLHCVCVERRT
jgi:hypothetical protein|eukprot:COSAG06_NODE_12040_length_1431_cov_1.736486_2_plen_165_part_00